MSDRLHTTSMSRIYPDAATILDDLAKASTEATAIIDKEYPGRAAVLVSHSHHLHPNPDGSIWATYIFIWRVPH